MQCRFFVLRKDDNQVVVDKTSQEESMGRHQMRGRTCSQISIATGRVNSLTFC